MVAPLTSKRVGDADALTALSDGESNDLEIGRRTARESVLGRRTESDLRSTVSDGFSARRRGADLTGPETHRGLEGAFGAGARERARGVGVSSGIGGSTSTGGVGLSTSVGGTVPLGRAGGTTPTREFAGPILSAADLSNDAEERLLRDSDGRARILPYGDFDASRPPVLLVHGLDGGPEHLQELADRLRADGHQVFFAIFDDRGSRTRDNSREIAEALRGLRETYYAEGTPLDIVAHSLGGLVSRGALNYLQDPGWLGEVSETEACPRAGFGPVQLRTIDSPFVGFDDGGVTSIPILGAIIQFFFWLFGWLGAFEVVAGSPFQRRMNDTRLEGVDFQATAARQEGEADPIPSIRDFDVGQRRDIATFLLGGEIPSDSRVANLARLIAADSRADELRQAVREARRAQPDADLGDLLLTEYARLYPEVRGSHMSILGTDADGDAFLQQLVEDLRH